MDDATYNGGEQLNMHDEGARRLTLDEQAEKALQVDAGDGHQLTALPPVGTVGGPEPPPADVETTIVQAMPAGGGAATRQEMEATDRPAQNLPTPRGS